METDKKNTGAIYSPVAQLVEHHTFNMGAVGSNPIGGTFTK